MSEWIKISERLPEELQDVLLLFSTGKRCVGYFSEKLGWTIEIGRVNPPTHWQPMPEPPKRESSFEAWWSSDHNWPIWRDYKTAAREAWDAAVAASKRPDFVP